MNSFKLLFLINRLTFFIFFMINIINLIKMNKYWICIVYLRNKPQIAWISLDMILDHFPCNYWSKFRFPVAVVMILSSILKNWLENNYTYQIQLHFLFEKRNFILIKVVAFLVDSYIFFFVQWYVHSTIIKQNCGSNQISRLN